LSPPVLTYSYGPKFGIGVSIYSARAYSSSDAIRGATRGPVLLVHVMAEVKCLEMGFKSR